MEILEIRKATIDDLQSILNLYTQPGIDDARVLDLPTAELIFRRMGQYPNYSVYVAIYHGEIIGTFALLIMDNLAHVGAPSGIVEDVVIHSNWRGHGFGKQMMLYAMDQCRQAKCYKMMLSSNLIREPAHRFYEVIGFVRHGYSFVVPLSE